MWPSMQLIASLRITTIALRQVISYIKLSLNKLTTWMMASRTKLAHFLAHYSLVPNGMSHTRWTWTSTQTQVSTPAQHVPDQGCNGLLIRRFWVQVPGGAPHKNAGQRRYIGREDHIAIRPNWRATSPRYIARIHSLCPPSLLVESVKPRQFQTNFGYAGEATLESSVGSSQARKSSNGKHFPTVARDGPGHMVYNMIMTRKEVLFQPMMNSFDAQISSRSRSEDESRSELQRRGALVPHRCRRGAGSRPEVTRGLSPRSARSRAYRSGGTARWTNGAWVVARGEIFWAELGAPAGRRPVCVLTRATRRD